MTINKSFVVKNGLEVNTGLILANSSTQRVGIGSTIPTYTLDVRGGIGATHSIVSGTSTVTNLVVSGTVSVGSSTGTTGQYLVSTGAGVTWGSVPTVRTVDTQTAGVGIATFNTTYSVGLLDVFVNGVKLSSDEFTATDNATVVLDDACFGGETVEFVSYSPFGIGLGGTSIQGITILDEGTPVGSSAQVTSINFVGAAVTAVGTGVGVTVYLSNFVASAGVATFATTAGVATYASSAGIATYATTAGVATYASSAGIATFATTAGVATNVIGGIASVTSVTAGIVTATSGFISVGNTTPITIDLVGNQLTFTAVGIGSTTFTLF